MAYLRLICNPDDDLSFKRIVNEPKRGIGAASIEKLTQFANEAELSLMASIDEVDNGIARATLNKFIDFKQMIYMLRSQIEAYSIAEFIDLVIVESSSARSSLSSSAKISFKSTSSNWVAID